jgi:hypothetical protein
VTDEAELLGTWYRTKGPGALGRQIHVDSIKDGVATFTTPSPSTGYRRICKVTIEMLQSKYSRSFTP